MAHAERIVAENLANYSICFHSGRGITLVETDPDSNAITTGASYLVVDVEPAADGSGRTAAFVVERLGRTAPGPGERDRRIVDRLKQVLAIRSSVLGALTV